VGKRNVLWIRPNIARGAADVVNQHLSMPLQPTRAPGISRRKVKMKILQVMSGPFSTGAGRGALALHNGLARMAVETRYLGRIERDPPAGITATRFSDWDWLSTGIRNRLYLSQLRRRFGQSEILFHPISHGHAPHRHPLFSWADLVHVQWSQAATLGPDFWRCLPTLRRPLVFSLRDMWLFTGGCHFAGTCTNYQRDCTHCPLLGGSSQISSADLRRKRAALPHATAFVAISEHIAAAARSSAVLHDADIRVILNSVNTDAFRIIDKAEARHALGLPAHGFIVATGALNLSEPRKGGALMPRVTAALADQPGLHWALFGDDPWPLPANASWFGRIDDDARINLILSAADMFVMPSLQEGFAKTIAEALAAGTPVLAFDDTPATEIIRNGQTGWIVPHGDADALIAGIRAAAALTPETRTAFGHAGRRDVLARHAPDVVARAHVELYAELIDRNRRPKAG
jgi:glycosyltransferase involved in cell wall biosynthesis